VRFVESVGDSAEHLKNLIATFVGRVLAAQKANAAGTPGQALVLEHLGQARRVRMTGYVCHRLKEGRWWRIPTRSPVQPSDGFTVAAYEDENEVHALCTAYERADEEGRRLIRLVAEVSVMSVQK
jgi:hypothetical protein